MRWILALPGLALLFAPLAGIVLGAGGAPPSGIGAALAHAVATAAAATALAVVVGAPAALAMRSMPRSLRAAVFAGLAAPWLVPGEVLALALAPVAGLLGGTVATILTGAMLAAGLVTLGGWLALRRVSEGELRAAAAAGALPGLVLRRFLLPPLLRGLAAGAAIGFAASASGSTIAARLAAPGARGLPAALLDLLRDAEGPEMLPGIALAGLLALLVPLLALIVANVLVRRAAED